MGRFQHSGSRIVNGLGGQWFRLTATLEFCPWFRLMCWLSLPRRRLLIWCAGGVPGCRLTRTVVPCRLHWPTLWWIAVLMYAMVRDR
jgi:hypothetical protein